MIYSHFTIEFLRIEKITLKLSCIYALYSFHNTDMAPTLFDSHWLSIWLDFQPYEILTSYLEVLNHLKIQ